MTRIFYLLKAVIKKTPIEADDEEIIAAVGKKIRIIPTVEEEPPLSLADNCIEYRTKEETTIKQGLRRNKQGQLTLSALQPRPLQLELSSNNTTQSTGTVTTLDLRFVPETDEQPPQLNTLTSKIKALTFLSGEPLPDYPTNLTIPDGLKFNKYTYQRTVPLLSLRVTSVRWQRHDCHCSGLKLSPSPDVFYTTSIVIPTNLPDGKAFVPTFHSCFVSRVYALELSLSYFTLNRLEKTASLRVPVQITCRRGLDLDI